VVRLAFEEKKSGGTSMITPCSAHHRVPGARRAADRGLPGAVMSAVPFGIRRAVTSGNAASRTTYFQIGLLVLIGLGAKNAVLRVSAAVEFRHQGETIMEATVLAGEQRLRPIIMTSLAFAMAASRSRSR
jgi:multidrug efflux pump